MTTKSLKTTTTLRDGGADADYALIDENGNAVVIFRGYTRHWGTEVATGAEIFVPNKAWLQIQRNTR